MLKITNQQLDAMLALKEAEANRILAERAIVRFPTTTRQISGDELLLTAVRARSSAKQFGIDREDNVAIFFDLTIMYGVEFFNEPWASEILFCSTLHGPDKMALLCHLIRSEGVNL